jgi:hypothetical protein
VFRFAFGLGSAVFSSRNPEEEAEEEGEKEEREREREREEGDDDDDDDDDDEEEMRGGCISPLRKKEERIAAEGRPSA